MGTYFFAVAIDATAVVRVEAESEEAAWRKLEQHDWSGVMDNNNIQGPYTLEPSEDNCTLIGVIES
jgi:hypothetical protein